MEDMKQPLFAAVSVEAHNLADVVLENSIKVSEDRSSLHEIIE